MTLIDPEQTPAPSTEKPQSGYQKRVAEIKALRADLGFIQTAHQTALTRYAELKTAFDELAESRDTLKDQVKSLQEQNQELRKYVDPVHATSILARAMED